MRNVVFVCLDTVRADTFRRFASRLEARPGFAFRQARAASSWTVPSHASILTGDLPAEHGVHTHNRDYRTLDPSETFFDALDTHRKIGVSANVFASEAFGFDRFFDEFDTVSNVCTYPDGLDLGEYVSDSERDHPLVSFLVDALGQPNRVRSLANAATAGLDHLATGRPVPNLLDSGGAAVTRAAKARVRETDEPFFLFLNLMEAHTPLEPSIRYDTTGHEVPLSFTTRERSVWDLMGSVEEYPRYVERWRDLYAVTVDYLDRLVDRLVDWLLDRTDGETTIVVTADHGENLGYPNEEGYVRHKSSLSEGLLHVPLLVINPPAGDEPPVDRYVSHLDLGRFLVGLARGELRDPTRDRIAAELVGMSAGPPPPSNRAHWDRMIRCAYADGEKFCWDSQGVRARYRLDAERPSWQARLAEPETLPPRATEFFATDITDAKRRAKADETEPAPVTDATKARLERLGYR